MVFLPCLLASVLVTTIRAASTSSGYVCTTSQCLNGYTNTPLAATLSSPALSAPILLLPGTYSPSAPSLPSVLLSALQSPLTTISLPSPTLLNSTSASSSSISLPLTLAQISPLLTFPNANFSGAGGSISFPATNASFARQVLSLNSLMLSNGLWAAFSTNSSSGQLIVWESINDLTQLSSNSPFSTTSSLNLISLQSSSCPTPCSAAGTCTTGGTCNCPSNFAGTSCETCAAGFFGPSCQKCPTNCFKCDDGPTGTGACLSATTANPPSSCNCLNGVCSSSGDTCTCNSGWTTNTSANSTQCSVCADGFFNNGNGECQACALGCTKCSNGSGTCTTCASGLTQDTSNPSQCIVATGSSTCSDGTFNNAGTCTACSTLCKTCKGPLSTDCIICGASRSSLSGQCVPVDANGVCTPSDVSQVNTTMVANNAKNVCDTCPSTCTACQIPGFSVASTIGQAQCTKCLPGYVLSGGRCVEQCPTGSFVNPSGDGFTCIACDASCGSCAGKKNFCLTCSQSGFAASNGTCVSTCPSGTFSSNGACLPCHADCQVCSGAGFDKCTACSPSRPVLSSNGRCLLTCGKNQFYDTSSGGTGACAQCDSSCATCTGPGSSNCLSCPSGRVLHGGTCVDARCPGGDDIGVVAALGGICLSSLVTTTPPASSVTVSSPASTVTVLTSARPSAPSSHRHLATWQLILMVIGALAILVSGLMLWRRRARIARAQDTQAFREAKLAKSSGILAFFGFGPNTSQRRHRRSRGHHGLGGRPQDPGSGDGWRYEMETVEQGLARRRSSVLHSPINERFAASLAPTDVRSRRQQHRAASVYSKASTSSSFTSPSSPRERDSHGNAVGIPPRRPPSNDGTAWTAPSEYSQPSFAGGRRYKRSSPPPPVPEHHPSPADASGYLAVPQPRQPIKDMSTARFAGDSSEAAGPDLLSGVAFATPTGSSPMSTSIDPHYRTQALPQIQPLVDVPLVSSDGLVGGSGGGANQWMQAVNQMPSNSPQRGKNPFRTY